jgi:hypothetical protein
VVGSPRSHRERSRLPPAGPFPGVRSIAASRFSQRAIGAAGGGDDRGQRRRGRPFEHLGARIYPDTFSLAQAHKALDSEGLLVDTTMKERFDTNIVNFMDSVEANKHYPCVKKAWVEYLGEHPEPAIDRVE